MTFGKRRRQRVERPIVCGENVLELWLRVGKAQVVKAGPQHSVTDQLLLHQRLLKQRIARRGVEVDDRAAGQPARFGVR